MSTTDLGATAQDCTFCGADAFKRDDGWWECDFGHEYEEPELAPADSRIERVEV